MIKKAELKEIFKEASELVEDIPEPVRSKAFEIAVTHLLGVSTEVKSLEIVNQSAKMSEGKTQAPVESRFFEKMSKELGIELEQLKTIYRLDKKGDLKVIAQLTGENAAGQRNLAFLYLLAKKVGLGEEWVSAFDFAKQAKSYGIYDGHVSKNLSKEKKILQSGRRRGKEYGLTPTGEAQAIEMLREMVEGKR